MLRRNFLVAAVAGTVCAVPLSALPLGNPLDATWLSEGVLWEGNDCDNACLGWADSWSLRIGYYGDFVFDRRLEVDDSPNDSDIRKTRMITNAAYLALNMWDRIDVFGTIGETKFHIETPGSAFSLNIPSTSYNFPVEVETETYFSWSIGVRGTLWECGRFGLGAEAQYFHTRPRLNYIQTELTEVFYFNNDARTNYREYQCGLGATYQIPIAGCGTFVVPYAGIKWSQAYFKLDDYGVQFGSIFPYEATMHNLNSHHHWGAVIGITLVGCDVWSFTAEGRFADELALHINSQLRF